MHSLARDTHGAAVSRFTINSPLCDSVVYAYVISATAPPLLTAMQHHYTAAAAAAAAAGLGDDVTDKLREPARPR